MKQFRSSLWLALIVTAAFVAASCTFIPSAQEFISGSEDIGMVDLAKVYEFSGSTSFTGADTIRLKSKFTVPGDVAMHFWLMSDYQLGYAELRTYESADYAATYTTNDDICGEVVQLTAGTYYELVLRQGSYYGNTINVRMWAD
ncbi:MAG TPA: hypothetical protein PLI66_08375 [Spirochaetales bacterium]|nr:hypothetical protein [Spirochaetales bacterium]